MDQVGLVVLALRIPGLPMAPSVAMFGSQSSLEALQGTTVVVLSICVPGILQLLSGWSIQIKK